MLQETFIVVIFLHLTVAWQRWDYSTQWSDLSAEEALQKQQEWIKIWGGTSEGNIPGPRPRRGHSLVLFHSPNTYPYYGDSYIIMFGGRDNDANTTHIPMTYDLENDNGDLQFKTYDSKPINPCNDVNGTYYTLDQRIGCNHTVDNPSIVPVGIFYNDVWAYKLCTNTPPYRYFNGPCVSTGWVVWDEGAKEGGCEYKLDSLVCTKPSERYNHGAVIFDDGAMLIYGGFSQRCTDYCDDLWMFDVQLQVWREVYYPNTLSRLMAEVLPDGTEVPYTPGEVPVDNGGFAGPGKRWRHSMVGGDAYLDSDGRMKQQMAIFGGHRLWQGFSAENSQNNDWGNYSARPAGGYMNDLWIYTRELDVTGLQGVDLLSYLGSWTEVLPIQVCGLENTCSSTWPSIRAGHASAFDSVRNLIWIFGGYATYFPYLSTGGEGSGPGSSSAGGGSVPYPAYNYYMNDLWFYNLSSGMWTEVVVDVSGGGTVPKGRMDCVFLLLGDLFFLNGGYGDNIIFDETWYFNITSLRWLQKKEFMTAEFPAACTDDLQYIQNASNNCTQLMWPKRLQRDDFYPFNISDFSLQPFYWPNIAGPNGSGLSIQDYNVLPFGTDANMSMSLLTTPANGTSLFPYSASGPMQYVRPFNFRLNSTFSLTVLESCTSVFSETTRGTLLDGAAGRSTTAVFIAQARRQRAGWDGCRDRFDTRSDLPNELQYVRPLARFSHRAVFDTRSREILMYGGMAFLDEHAPSVQDSYPIAVSQEMWFYALDQCQNNCSRHGDCLFGYCLCDVGYYGIDCSNSSCSGSFCYYDINQQQICKHACHAGYVHTDQDVYVADIAKLPCSCDSTGIWGESNGICDGFGTSYCAPPFVGDDCSIKDCAGNCSFNGWCSEEYPVSRCMCQPGYYGEMCEYRDCLNNCTHPNGVCDPVSGVCVCNMIYSPYNNAREYRPWGGEDCSYLFAYAAADQSWHTTFAVITLLLATAIPLMFI